MMIVANPIYDVVFKYLMEDERIARTIISALLKKDVLEVHMRRNEYSNKSRDTLSIFRIDFGATILDDKGERQTILIEIQKTQVDSELLRFRQYLGAQYDNKENMEGEGRSSHALPMVAVYLLGHTVGSIDAPVVYVDHQVYDYDRNVVEDGIKDPFVESLTHDSIIVQIPRLHGKINNRLDKVLSIFDQTHVVSDKNQQTVDIDPSVYGDDNEMEPILRKLMEVSCDKNVRREMDVEDEFFSVLKNREEEIMAKDRQLAKSIVAIKEAEERQAQAEEQRAQAEERQAQAEERQAQAEERAEQMMRNTVVALLKKQVSAEDIAALLGVDVMTVKQIETEELH
ncbi:MAG: cell envelope integrity protein TolA [Prevotella sp.]|nr:cell envelope integrity protein TolA [Prevotella sp.]